MHRARVHFRDQKKGVAEGASVSAAFHCFVERWPTVSAKLCRSSQIKHFHTSVQFLLLALVPSLLYRCQSNQRVPSFHCGLFRIGVSVSAVSQNLQAPTVEEYPFEVRVRQEPAVPVRSTFVHVPSQEEVHLEGPHAKRS
jgi:hypothetical protein